MNSLVISFYLDTIYIFLTNFGCFSDCLQPFPTSIKGIKGLNFSDAWLANAYIGDFYIKDASIKGANTEAASTKNGGIDGLHIIYVYIKGTYNSSYTGDIYISDLIIVERLKIYLEYFWILFSIALEPGILLNNLSF